MLNLFQIEEFIYYWITSFNKYKIHSPYIYRLVTEVFEKELLYEDFDRIERVRDDLKDNDTVIDVVDLGAGSGPGRDEDSHGLCVVSWIAGARVEQVGIAFAVDFEKTLIVAWRADRFAVVQGDGGHRAGLARVLDADTPFFSFLAAQRHDVAANVDQRVVDALRAKNGGGTVKGNTL